MATFKEAIENATMKWTEYKQKENAYKGKVNKGLDDLEKLIGELNTCIKKLVDLQDDYSSYIQRITDIRIKMQDMLNQQITQIKNNSGEECDKKIGDLLKMFQTFVVEIKTWEGDASRFEVLLTSLKKEIDKLCVRADEIVTKNDQNKTSLDEELRKVEERLNLGGSASKEDVGDDESKEENYIRESKGEETFVRAQAQAVDRGDGLAAQEISSRRNNQVGGWRSPNELKSIPYGTPVRTVNIKYNKTKNKKKKNKKKRGTRKNKKKQSRRKRRKGRKGKRN